MKIFINDIPVILTSTSHLKVLSSYDMVIDGAKEKINPKTLLDDVLVLNASPESVDHLLHLMTDKKFKDLDSITFASEKNHELKAFIKSKFKVIEAAGGVVEKDGKLLLIFRQKKWDLPKGKIDKGENRKSCAVREIEEETGVQVSITGKICHTWHTYMSNKRYVLKKTYWYAMRSMNDENMAPQADEGIDEVRWMMLSEIRAALYGSYRSIRVVIQEYNKLLKEKTQL